MQCKSYTWVTRGTKTAQQKTAEQKLVGTLGHWVMGKCKKVRRTKTVEQNWWGPSGTLSASTERSVEQKVVEQKCWWGPLQTLSAKLLVLALRVLEGSHQIFDPHFLYQHFCSADLLVLALRV